MNILDKLDDTITIDYDINLIYLDCNIIKIYSTKIIRYVLIDVLKIA